MTSENWDRAGAREWLTYRFWTPKAFAISHGIAERTVRHMITLGMPHHGHPHKGRGGIRLSGSAAEWLTFYRAQTRIGRYRFTALLPETLHNIQTLRDEEAQAFARLYKTPIPCDPYLESHAQERRSWTRFKEINREANT